MRDYPNAMTSSPSEAISTAQGQTSGTRGPDRGGPRLEELLVHGILVVERVEAYPLEDILVDHPEHRQVDLEVRLPEYIR